MPKHQWCLQIIHIFIFTFAIIATEKLAEKLCLHVTLTAGPVTFSDSIGLIDLAAFVSEANGINGIRHFTLVIRKSKRRRDQCRTTSRECRRELLPSPHCIKYLLAPSIFCAAMTRRPCPFSTRNSSSNCGQSKFSSGTHEFSVELYPTHFNQYTTYSTNFLNWNTISIDLWKTDFKVYMRKFDQYTNLVTTCTSLQNLFHFVNTSVIDVLVFHFRLYSISCEKWNDKDSKIQCSYLEKFREKLRRMYDAMVKYSNWCDGCKTIEESFFQYGGERVRSVW